MGELKERVTELAQLMAEYGLDRARLQGDGWRVEFAREVAESPALPESEEAEPRPSSKTVARKKPAATAEAAAPQGIPISSPMMGVFYTAPSPGASPFINEGDDVVAGQVVGLIEAMKVFNEITSTVSGKVLKVVAASGQLVQPGEPLLYIG